jgi:predicted CoA-binding protein
LYSALARKQCQAIYLSQKEIKEILAKFRVIAVVGLSSDHSKPSYQVAEYMQSQGYRIVPVNPFVKDVLGEKSYQDLLEVPEEVRKTIDIVDIFRRAEEIPAIVQQAIKLKEMHGKPHVIWMQLEIVNEQAAQIAREAGLAVIMNKCIMVEHKRHC